LICGHERFGELILSFVSTYTLLLEYQADVTGAACKRFCSCLLRAARKRRLGTPSGIHTAKKEQRGRRCIEGEERTD